MLFGLRQLSRKILWIFCFCLYVFLLVVMRHIPNNYRSQLLSQDVYRNPVKGFSLQLFVLMTLKLKKNSSLSFLLSFS